MLDAIAVIHDLLTYAGWKVVNGVEGSGKTYLLRNICSKYSCNNYLGSVKSGEIKSVASLSLQICWLDMIGLHRFDEVYSKIAEVLNLKGGNLYDISFAFRLYLKSLPVGSIIVLDHLDHSSISNVVSILKSFIKNICMVAICQDLSHVFLSGIETTDIVTLDRVSFEYGVSIASGLLSETDVGEDEVICMVSNSTLRPKHIVQLCAFRTHLGRSLPDTCSVDDLFDAILRDADRQLSGCFGPLLVVRGAPFNTSLAWYLSRDVFPMEDAASPCDNWLESFHRLCQSSWIEAIPGTADLDTKYRLTTHSLPGRLSGHREGRWDRYFAYWARELQLLNMEALRDLQCNDHKECTPPSFTWSPSIGPILALCSACSQGPQRALATFDAARPHFESLISFWEESTFAADKQTANLSRVAASLAGQLGLVCSARLPVDRAIAVAKAVLEYCPRDSSKESTVARVSATIELAGFLVASGTTAAAGACALLRGSLVSLYAAILTASVGLDAQIVFADGSDESEVSDEELCAYWGAELIGSLLSTIAKCEAASSAEGPSILRWKQRALKVWRSTISAFSMARPEIIVALRDSSASLASDGLYENSVSLLREAQDVCEQVFGESHILSAEICRQLARCRQLQGFFSEANSLLDRAWDIHVSVYGSGHLEQAAVLREKARNMFLYKRLPEALSLIEAAFAIVVEELGSQHVTTGETLAEKAAILEATGSWEQAEACYTAAIAAMRSSIGEHDARIAHAMERLGRMLQNCGKLREARPPLEAALVVLQGLSGGAQSAAAANILYLLAVLDQEINGQSGEAEQLYNRALAIYRSLGSRHHLDVAEVLTKLGKYCHEFDKVDEAEFFLEEALIIYRQRLGQASVKSAEGFSSLAFVLLHGGRPAEAAAVFQQAVESYDKLYPKGHPDYADAINDLASAHHAAGHFTEALAKYEEALDMHRKMGGERCENVAKVLNNKATLLDDIGRSTEALETYEIVLDILHHVHGERHPQVILTLQNIASLFEDEGSVEEATKVLCRVRELYAAMYGEEHEAVRETDESIDSLLEIPRSKTWCILI